MHPLTVLVAEDHDLVRAGFCSLLNNMEGVRVVGEAREGLETLKKVESLLPNMVLLDISMPGLNGLEVAKRIIREHPEVKVVILSVHATEEYVLKALKIGAKGYLVKDSGVEELALAVKTVIEGGTYISPKVSGHLINRFLRDEPLERDPLTDRQREILQMIAEGLTTKEIAARLNLSIKTVDAHRLQIMQRLDIHDVASLVRYAIRTGLIAPE